VVSSSTSFQTPDIGGKAALGAQWHAKHMPLLDNIFEMQNQ
jgi:hypothetical protein